MPNIQKRDPFVRALPATNEIAELSDRQEDAPLAPLDIAAALPTKVAAIAEVAAKEDSVENTPPEYRKEELLPMLDTLLQHGYVLTEFSIRSTKVVLRSRFAWEDQEMFTRMDRAKLDTALAYQQRFTLLSIAAGLVSYGTKVFEPINSNKEKMSASFDERVEFVESLPTIVTDIIYQKWHKFNSMHGYMVSHIDELMTDF